ncbi:TadE/TadG family type IV pilus assembly protein [Ruegeria arenilitoris]|uniref:TadE/TadG family type IV pilus assembly protein n=1 Tax=Ruegeria arenilitoris TaxID=1173585 RepID=UPI00147BBF63|nr:pilus assembly protein [Ruegeria arenilitoris]
MTRFFSRFRRSLGIFAVRENGSLSLETALIFPVLVWAITLTYTYFDGFRESTANLKAAFTISDLISREGEREVTDTYATSMYLLFNRMVGSNSPLQMRLTVITYIAPDEDTGTEEDFIVNWSTHCGYQGIWTDDNVKPLADRLPAMANLDTLIIVETSKEYVPRLNTSWLTKDYVFDNFVFSRPRFVPIVKGTPSTQFCADASALAQTAPGA